MSELPSGWAKATIADVTLPFESDDPSREPGKAIDYIDIGAIDNSTQRITDPKRHLGRDAPSRARRIVATDDVLFSTVRTYLKNIARVPPELDRAYTSTGIAVLRPSEGVDSSFLFHWVCSAPFLETISKAQDGTMYPAVSDREVAAAEILVPPLAEQRRIVEKLNAVTASTARARADLDRVPALASRYRQAILTKAFSGELTPQVAHTEFEERPLSEALHSTFYGPRFAKEAYVSTGIPTLRTTDFDDFGRVRLKEPPKVSVSANEYEKWGLRDGDLLVTRTGSIGKCAVYNEAMGPALPSAYLIRLRLQLEMILPRFALLFLLSPNGQKQLGLGITAVTQPNINAGVLERLQLPVPSIETQSEIIARVETAFAEIDRLAAEAACARKLLGRLDQAVLTKAFRGELAPQDPADEPASALLDRIRADRAAAPKPKRGRRSATPTTPKRSSMPKSRLDDDVKGRPFLASILKGAGSALSASDLFKSSDLPITDFYKQLAWELDQGLVKERGETLEAA